MSTAHHELRQSGLIAVLDEQIRNAQAMLSALDHEQDALREGDAEGLNAAGADKARLVETLESLEHERRDLASVLEIELASVDDTDAAVKWRELLQLIAECRRRNHQNGGLVKARREQVLSALKVLRGSDQELYDAHGLERAPSGARRLGSA
jgi:flagellar biosynthesis/type III secretory pathway chaperone